MTIGTILMYSVGTVIIQVAIAVVIDKLRHAGKPRREKKAAMVFVEGEPPAYAFPSQAASEKTLSELTAMLIALSPEPKGTACSGVSAKPTAAEPKALGPVSGECPANPSPIETATDSGEPATPTGGCVGFTLVNSAYRLGERE